MGQASRAHADARRGALPQRLLHGIRRLAEELREGGGDARQALRVKPSERNYEDLGPGARTLQSDNYEPGKKWTFTLRTYS